MFLCLILPKSNTSSDCCILRRHYNKFREHKTYLIFGPVWWTGCKLDHGTWVLWDNLESGSTPDKNDSWESMQAVRNQLYDMIEKENPWNSISYCVWSIWPHILARRNQDKWTWFLDLTSDISQHDGAGYQVLIMSGCHWTQHFHCLRSRDPRHNPHQNISMYLFPIFLIHHVWSQSGNHNTQPRIADGHWVQNTRSYPLVFDQVKVPIKLWTGIALRSKWPTQKWCHV